MWSVGHQTMSTTATSVGTAFLLAASAFLGHLLRLPSHLLLVGLHTYILPDSLPSESPGAILLHPPNSNSNSNSNSSAQLLRLRISLSDLHSRPHFLAFHSSFLFSFPSLLLLLLPSFPPPFLPFLSASVSSLFLVVLLLLLLSPSSSPSSLPLLSLPLTLPFAFLFPSSPSSIAVAIAFSLSFLLRSPAALSARSFWLATDQPRLRLPVLAPSPLSRLLLHLSLLSSPVASLLSPTSIPSLAAAPLLHLLALRISLQSFLNESVLSWYQRLHAARAPAPPDLAYARAKVFLHDRRVCAVATHLLAPPLLSLLLLGLSQLSGNLFAGVPFSNCFRHYSDSVKDTALFLSWWITFAGSVLTLSNLALYRLGWLFIS